MADGRRSRPIQDNFRPFAPDDCICDLASIRCTEAAGTEKPIRGPPARPFLRHFFTRGGGALAIWSIKPDSQRRPDASRPPGLWSPRSRWLEAWQNPAKAEIFPAMLPGFRFLFAAVVMSMSVLVFGLGAAALMRTAHEDFAANTSWRAPPEPRFARQDETASPVLATLIVRPRAAEPMVSPTENVATEPGSETTAALSRTGASPCEAAKPGVAMTVASIQSPTQVDAAAKAEPAQTPVAPQTDAPASTDDAKIEPQIEPNIAA